MSYTPSLTSRATAERKTWQFRAVEYTHGNKSIIGALVVAILGRKVNPPCFHPGGARITADGRVLALFNSGQGFKVQLVYSNVAEFTNAFRGLAAELKLTDAEQEDMFAEVRKWILKDDRVRSTIGPQGEDFS